MKSIFLLTSCLVLISSIQAWAAPENVFDEDTRTPVVRLTAPTKFIGKLLLPNGGWCSAGLVYRDIVVTAAHCISDDKTKTLKTGTFSFYYGVVNNVFQDYSPAVPVAWGTVDTSGDRASDWALMRLQRPLGTKYGWMGLRSIDLTTIFNKGGVDLTGYSSDFQNGRTAGMQRNCSFTGASNGSVLHNCNMTKGASGAPMYRAEVDENGRTVYFVLAINVADRRDGKVDSLVGIPFTTDHANVAVPVSRFLGAMQKIIAEEAK